MKTMIPCKITYSDEDKCWYVEAPEFYSGILTYGNTLEEARKMAVEAVSGLLESYLEHGDSFTIPKMQKRPDWYGIELDPGLSFAIWLRSMRKSRNMTLADVADKMGVKYQVYQKLENPKMANPTLKTLKKLEQIFDTELITV
ncbi:MAG: type II toxin-antitoxin system HicB family antitoxin [Spirochaetaceae bacterium]|jgi:antitoxin HicB|nr:type II toxin-antitoxin system HicB family antitoxin [Spirochaetaceae bacterium]